MGSDPVARYLPFAIGAAAAFGLLWWSARRATRGEATTWWLGLPPPSERQVLWFGLATLLGLATLPVLDNTIGNTVGRSFLVLIAWLGMLALFVLVGVRAHKRRDMPVPRVGPVLRWLLPIALLMLGLAFVVRQLTGASALTGAVGGIALGLLPGIVLLAAFALAVRVGRWGRN